MYVCDKNTFVLSDVETRNHALHRPTAMFDDSGTESYAVDGIKTGDVHA